MESDSKSSHENKCTNEKECTYSVDANKDELNKILPPCKSGKNCDRGDSMASESDTSKNKHLGDSDFVGSSNSSVSEKKEQCDVSNSHVTPNCVSENVSEPLLGSPGGEEVDVSEPSNKPSPTSRSEEKNYDPTPNVPRPKHRWIAPREAMLRQYGTSAHYSPSLFRQSCYSSLHMVERLELMYKMKKHEGCVNTLNFSASGTKLVSGSDDLVIIIWDWSTSEPILEYNSGHRSNVFQAKFIPLSGDCQIVTCARDGQVRIAELTPSGKCESTKKLAQHKGAAHKLAVQQDSSNSFISCGEDAVVFEIDLRESKPEKIVVCKENDKKIPLYSVYINPSKCYEYVVGGRDQYVRVYDKRCIREDDGILKKFCPQHLIGQDVRANVTSVVYSYNGEEILASYNDEDIYLFDDNAGNMNCYLHSYKGHRNSQTVKGVNFFGAKSEYIISGSDCGYIFFWEKQSEHIVKYMHGDEGGVVNCLEPNPNVPVLATSGLDDDIKIWVPSCETPPDLSGLRSHIINNMKEREEDIRTAPDTIDDEMIWYFMQQIRGIRQRRPSDGVSAESSSSSSESEGHDEEGDRVIQCRQS